MPHTCKKPEIKSYVQLHKWTKGNNRTRFRTKPNLCGKVRRKPDRTKKNLSNKELSWTATFRKDLKRLNLWPCQSNWPRTKVWISFQIRCPQQWISTLTSKNRPYQEIWASKLTSKKTLPEETIHHPLQWETVCQATNRSGHETKICKILTCGI